MSQRRVPACWRSAPGGLNASPSTWARWPIEWRGPLTSHVKCGASGWQPEAPLSLGAYLVVAAHPEVSVARQLARGSVGPYAHFSGMPGSPSSGLSEADRAVIEAVTADYKFSGHSTRHPSEVVRKGEQPALHVKHLDDAFLDRFAVVGTPGHCAAKLNELAALGLERVLLVEGRDAAAPEDERRAHQCLVDDVLPALRQAASK